MLAEERASLKAVLPQANIFKRVKCKDNKDINYYEVFDSESNLIGYAFKAQKRGYSSIIQTMVGVRPNGEIVNIKIISHRETPGLGTKIEEIRRGDSQPWFQAQFSGKTIDGLDKDVQAITGATISCKAVVDSVKEKVKEMLKVIGDKNINLTREEF